MYQIKHIVICKPRVDETRPKSLDIPFSCVKVGKSFPAIHYWGSSNLPHAGGKEGFISQEIPCITSVQARPTFDHFVHIDFVMGGEPDQNTEGFIIFFESDVPFLRINGNKLFYLCTDTFRKAVVVLEEGQFLDCKNIRFEVCDGLFLVRNM